MSVRIGSIKGHGLDVDNDVVSVSASVAGAEVRVFRATGVFTLDPTDARNFAALLVRAGDEAERMRERSKL